MNKICIHSVPRSGSTWLGCIFDSSEKVAYKFQPLFSYAFKDFLDCSSTTEEINDFFKRIKNSNDEFINQIEGKKSGIIPIFDKSPEPKHIVYKEVRYHNILKNLLEKDFDLKVIGLVRNPFAVINSWLKAPREFRVDLNWEELEEWRYAAKKNLDRPEEFYGFEKWKEVTLLFEELKIKFPKQFYLLNYDDLSANLEVSVLEIFDFCSIEMTKQTLSFLRDSQKKNNNNPYSVYKKKTSNEWKNSLNPIIIKKIFLDLKDSSLEKYII